MDNTLQSFESRQRAVRRKHTRMAQGYVTKLGEDGVFLQVADKKSGIYCLRILVMFLVGFLLFKGFVLYWLGAEIYQGHVDVLSAGTTVEKVGAFVMQIDPISAQIAALLMPFAS